MTDRMAALQHILNNAQEELTEVEGELALLATAQSCTGFRPQDRVDMLRMQCELACRHIVAGQNVLFIQQRIREARKGECAART